MPKLIDYPRTSYTSAWEIAETVDDTGGKCALETCARKLNRKVSGSFKAIVGSAVKFGLLTSKRELLTTTTLFRRIKHAYDKQEELLFHREAFLTPALFTQLCRKFRSRELPVAMLDVLLIREFDVEEINAQGVAKAFIDGARMVGLLNEQNTMADIDQLSNQQQPRRELSNVPMGDNIFRAGPTQTGSDEDKNQEVKQNITPSLAATTTGGRTNAGLPLPATRNAPQSTGDAIASLFGLEVDTELPATTPPRTDAITSTPVPIPKGKTPTTSQDIPNAAIPTSSQPLFKLQLNGPGLNTTLDVLDADDLVLVRALLDKIERQLKKG